MNFFFIKITWKWTGEKLQGPLNLRGFNKKVLPNGTKSVGVSLPLLQISLQAFRKAFVIENKNPTNLIKYDNNKKKC